MKTITVNDVAVNLTPATTIAREGNKPFTYNRMDLAQFNDDANPLAVAEVLHDIMGHDSFVGLLQSGLDRNFQAAQKEAGKDTLDDAAKLQAATDYMLVSKFGLNRTSNASPQERIVAEYQRIMKELKGQLTKKTINKTKFDADVMTALVKMQKDLTAAMDAPVTAPATPQVAAPM